MQDRIAKPGASAAAVSGCEKEIRTVFPADDFGMEDKGTDGRCAMKDSTSDTGKAFGYGRTVGKGMPLPRPPLAAALSYRMDRVSAMRSFFVNVFFGILTYCVAIG